MDFDPSSSSPQPSVCSTTTAASTPRLMCSASVTASLQYLQRTAPRDQAADTTAHASPVSFDGGLHHDASAETFEMSTTPGAQQASCWFSLPSVCSPPSSLQSTRQMERDQATEHSRSEPASAVEPSTDDQAGGHASSLQEFATTAIIDGVTRNLILKSSRTGYYGVSIKGLMSSTRPYHATVNGNHLGVFATAVEGAVAVWRYVDAHNYAPYLPSAAEALGPCPIGATAKRRHGKGCGGFQQPGKRIREDGPVDEQGRPKWRKGELFCGASACRPSAGVVNSVTRANDAVRNRKRSRENDESDITLPNFGLPSLQPSTMEPQLLEASSDGGAGVQLPTPLHQSGTAIASQAPDCSSQRQRLSLAAAALQPSASGSLLMPSQPSTRQCSQQSLPSQSCSQQSSQQRAPATNVRQMYCRLRSEPQRTAMDLQQSSPSQPSRPPSMPSQLSPLQSSQQSSPGTLFNVRQMCRQVQSGNVPEDLGVAFFPCLTAMLEAFNKADASDLPALLAGGFLADQREGVMQVRSKPLARQLTAAAARIRSIEHV